MDNNIENNQEQINTPKDSNNKNIISVIIVAVVIVVFAILLRGTTPNQKINNNTANNEDLNVSIREISGEDHILGNPNAKIKIVEYSDTGCPFCKMFHSTMHQVVEDFNGEVAWVYRHFPILSLHPEAFNEALATECAWEQGGNDMFWDFTDQIYTRTESNNSFTSEDLNKIAIDLNLNMTQFNECLASEKYADKVEQDILDGQLGGVRGTPSSFIVVDGEVVDQIEGAAPYQSVKAQIEYYLR